MTYFHYIILTRNTDLLYGWDVRREAKTESELRIVIFWVGPIQLETLGWAMPQPFFVWMEKVGKRINHSIIQMRNISTKEL